MTNSNSSVTIAPPDIGTETDESFEDLMRERIIHILTVYPIISYSMLQVGVGTSMPSSMWRPILKNLIQEGRVIEDHLYANSPRGRAQTYTQLRLRGTVVTFAAVVPFNNNPIE